MTTFDLSYKLAFDLVHSGGFTSDLNGNSPTTGYALSLYPEREWHAPASAVDPRQIQAFLDTSRALLENPGVYVGGWLDPTDNTVYLDVSQVIRNEQQALSVARARGQIAVYCFDTQQSIYLNQLERAA